MLRLFAGLLMCWAVVNGSTAWAQDPDTEPDTDDPDQPVEVVPGEIRMGIHPIADGIIRQGQWATVRVTLANGADSTDAFVRLEERSSLSDGLQSYTREVALPRGSKKDIQLLWRAGTSSSERVVTVGVGGEAVRRAFPVRVLGADDVGIGVIGEDSLGTVVMQDTWKGPVPGITPRPVESESRTVRSGLIPTADLPNKSAGLMALDWIIWPQADPSDITPEQLDALLAWVAGGGNLLVTATDTWQAVSQSELADAMPVEVLGVQDGTVSGWLDTLKASNSSDTIPVLTSVPRTNPDRSAVVLALADDGRPVWTAGVYGLGSVHVLGVDPSVGPLTQGLRRELLWRTLLWLPPTDATAAWFRFGPADMTSWFAYSGAARYPDTLGAEDLSTGGLRLAAGLGLVCLTERCSAVAPLTADQQPGMGGFGYGYGYGYGSTTAPADTFASMMRERLADIPGVAPLPLPWLGAFAVIYLMLIGPIDYIALRLIGKQPLTWITFPILVAIFSAVALVGTSLVKGSQAIVTRYEVVDVLPGTGLWRGHTWLGVFSTKKTELTLASGFDDAVVRPIGDGGFVQDARTRSNEGSGFYEWRAQTWSLAYVQTEWVGRQNGRIVVRETDNGIEVVNRLGVDLDRAELRAMGKFYNLGSLEDGEACRIVLPEPNLDALRSYVDSAGMLVPNGQPVDLKPLGMLAHYPETHGGSLQLEGPIGFVGMSDDAFEPLTLTGLTPVEQPVTVFRSPITTIVRATAEAP